MKKPIKAENQLWTRNPYTAALTEPVTLRLPHDAIKYFKQMAAESGLGREQVMELLLRQSGHAKQRVDVEPAPDAGVGRKIADPSRNEDASAGSRPSSMS